MKAQTLYNTYKRYRTLQTDRISALPVVILMPHSACNCRCIMCDIWKDNKNLRQLGVADIGTLISALRKFNTQEVVMSGGEALLNPNFFQLCQLLKSEGMKVTLLSTGLSVARHAAQIATYIDELILSLDGPPAIHDRIRNVSGAFEKLREGVDLLRKNVPGYRITSRTVIHKLNFRHWKEIVETGKELDLDRISFLPADVSSHAFNRQQTWGEERKNEILLTTDELEDLRTMIEELITEYKPEFDAGFIAESPAKILRIYQYYAAFYGLNEFPYKKCNAPWVSTVIEADGTVRPCFFHDPIGNIRSDSLEAILNSPETIHFRKNLDVGTNETCIKCVCSINLPPGTQLV